MGKLLSTPAAGLFHRLWCLCSHRFLSVRPFSIPQSQQPEGLLGQSTCDCRSWEEWCQAFPKTAAPVYTLTRNVYEIPWMHILSGPWCGQTSNYLLVCRRRQWHPTPVVLPGKSHGWRSLVGCSPWGRRESDTTEWLHFHFSLSCIGEGNGNPLHCSCLENPRDGVAWWAAVYGVAQSRTRLKRLSSGSSSRVILSRDLDLHFLIMNVEHVFIWRHFFSV